MAYGPRDPEAIARDLLIVFRHEKFSGTRPIEAMGELKAARRAR